MYKHNLAQDVNTSNPNIKKNFFIQLKTGLFKDINKKTFL